MLTKILVVMAMLWASVAFAAVDVNKATAAELDAVKGIGPAMSKRIMDERKKGEFKSWDDLISRIKGIGDGNAKKYSAEGLTVGGTTYKAAAATKKDEKKAEKAAKKEEKKEDKKAEKEMKKEDKMAAKPASAPAMAAKPASAPAIAAKPASAASAKK